MNTAFAVKTLASVAALVVATWHALKGSTLGDLQVEALWLAALMLLAMTIAVTRFRRTLD
jgi:hypothetical protein